MKGRPDPFAASTLSGLPALWQNSFARHHGKWGPMRLVAALARAGRVAARAGSVPSTVWLGGFRRLSFAALRTNQLRTAILARVDNILDTEVRLKGSDRPKGKVANPTFCARNDCGGKCGGSSTHHCVPHQHQHSLRQSYKRRRSPKGGARATVGRERNGAEGKPGGGRGRPYRDTCAADRRSIPTCGVRLDPSRSGCLRPPRSSQGQTGRRCG
jgi:hypothetical protein